MFNLFSEEALRLASFIEKNEGEIRFVGGCVRDSLLGRKVSDIDFATTLLPEKILSIFADQGHIKVIPTGLSHGTVTVVIHKKSFEITTLRRDIKCDGRHAFVEFTDNWCFDASRRDFTFNALYIDFQGTVYDYFNGVNHLKNGEIHFIGDPDLRICEDYLRIIRAFRFHSDICRVPMSESVVNACKKYAVNIDDLSGERIKSEFLKILALNNAHTAFLNMDICDVLRVVIPFDISYSFLKYDYSSLLDSFLKLIVVCLSCSDREGIFLYMRKRFVFSRSEASRFLALAEVDFEKIYLSIHSEQSRRVFLVKFGKKLYRDILCICMINNVLPVENFDLYLDVINIYKDVFPVSGADLKSIGYSGVEIGKKLRYLQVKWEDSGCVMSRDALIELLK